MMRGRRALWMEPKPVFRGVANDIPELPVRHAEHTLTTASINKLDTELILLNLRCHKGQHL